MISHNCFLEESVEEEIEEEVIDQCIASFLKYAFPLVRKLWEKSFCNKCELSRATNFPIIECTHDRTRDKKFNKKTAGSEHLLSYEVQDFHLDQRLGRDPMVRPLFPPYEK